jgi:hypothetical protein
MDTTEQRLVNCTPHEVTVGNIRIPASGEVARLDAVEIVAQETEFAGVPVTAVEFGQLRGVPDPAPGVRYIVSLPCVFAKSRWMWNPPRKDLLVPYLEVRDDSGFIVGARMLAKAV